MEAKRDLEFNIYTSINNKNKIIANINYNKSKNYSNIKLYDKELVEGILPIKNNGKDLNWDEIIKFLSSRCFNENDKIMLKNYGLDHYDIFDIIKLSNGKKLGDNFEIELIKY